MTNAQYDWGRQTVIFDEIKESIIGKNLWSNSEAETRFHVIDRIIREFLGWEYGQISVEPRQEFKIQGYVDYVLQAGDTTIVVEAKKLGADFPSPTGVKKVKLNSSLISTGLSSAINQAVDYAKSKVAPITFVTNGHCWCYFLTRKILDNPSGEVNILFPFDNNNDAEELFSALHNKAISTSGLKFFQDPLPQTSRNKLLTIVRDSETRIGRNNVADFLTPALDTALYSEAINKNLDFLKSTFVYTSSRSKFDSTLNMHLADSKPVSIMPASKIDTKRSGGELETLVKFGKPSFAPPVTLLIAEVGVGKSTYLKHFELVYGKELIETKKTHWIYVDFESMGRGGNVRGFIYRELLNYLLDTSKVQKTDYDSVIEPAYRGEIEGLRSGPFALISKDEKEFEKLVTEHIRQDLDKIEPYVDKIFKYISDKQLCVLVLDNIDLYEDVELEKSVLSEGLALAKKLLANVIISIRDTTYIKHKNDSVFDAYQLKKLWLEPPPFKEVLSKRLTLASLILRRKTVEIPFSNGMKLSVPDLSVFFEIVQRSLLSGEAGDFISSFAGQNIRKGLELVTNFLTSGHIHADKALQTYLGRMEYIFPFQEIFKGSILGQWRYYKESRSLCLNLFDSQLNSKRGRLLRLCLLAHLHNKAKLKDTIKVPVINCVEIFTKLGVSGEQILRVLNDLLKYQLIRQEDATELNMGSRIFITRSGGYYFVELCSRMPYVEACIYDTTIDDTKVWQQLSKITQNIESETNLKDRMELRKKRFGIFISYILELESDNISILGEHAHQPHIEVIKVKILDEYDKALKSIEARDASK